MNVNISNELTCNFAYVCRSVNYIGSLARGSCKLCTGPNVVYTYVV